MQASAIALVAAVIAGGLAVVFFLSGRAAARERDARAKALEDARRDLEDARRKAAEATDLAGRRGEELESLRKKHGKAKKRAARAEQEKGGRGEREAELAAELAETRQEVKTLREALDRAQAAAAKKPAPPERPAPEGTAAPAPAKAAPRPEDEGATAKETARADAAETEVAELKRTLAARDHELKKARGRAETSNRVYLVIKGELDVAKDRLRMLEKQLRRAEGGAPPEATDA